MIQQGKRCVKCGSFTKEISCSTVECVGCGNVEEGEIRRTSVRQTNKDALNRMLGEQEILIDKGGTDDIDKPLEVA